MPQGLDPPPRQIGSGPGPHHLPMQTVHRLAGPARPSSGGTRQRTLAARGQCSRHTPRSSESQPYLGPDSTHPRPLASMAQAARGQTSPHLPGHEQLGHGTCGLREQRDSDWSAASSRSGRISDPASAYVYVLKMSCYIACIRALNMHTYLPFLFCFIYWSHRDRQDI